MSGRQPKKESLPEKESLDEQMARHKRDVDELYFSSADQQLEVFEADAGPLFGATCYEISKKKSKIGKDLCKLLKDKRTNGYLDKNVSDDTRRQMEVFCAELESSSEREEVELREMQKQEILEKPLVKVFEKYGAVLGKTLFPEPKKQRGKKPSKEKKAKK